MTVGPSVPRLVPCALLVLRGVSVAGCTARAPTPSPSASAALAPSAAPSAPVSASARPGPLEGATSVEVFSLGANRWRGPGRDDRPRLHEYPVLGSTKLEDPAAKGAIGAALARDTASGVGAWCFLPRHAVRVERDGKRTDWVICYECKQLEVRTDAGEKNALVAFGETSHALLDAALRKAGVAIETPEPAKDPVEVAVTSGDLDREARIALVHRFNGIAHACEESSELWRPHPAGDVELAVGLERAKNGDPTPPRSVRVVRDATPRGMGKCFARDLRKEPLALPASATRVELSVRHAIREVR